MGRWTGLGGAAVDGTYTPGVSDTTTVRIDRAVRERLRRVEERLGLTTAEALARAVDSLDREILWTRVGAYYAEHPEVGDEDAGWIDEVQRAQR